MAKTSTAKSAVAELATPPPVPETYVFLEPSTRAYALWSPSLLRAAEISADGGDLSLAADLCETMIADDRIKAVLDSRTDALLGRDLSFSAGLGRRKNRAVKALDIEEDWWAAFPESDLKQLHAWGIMLGVGLAEMRWEESAEHGGRMIPRLEVKHPRWLRYNDMTRKWELTVATEGGGFEVVTITPGDGKWILYTPYGRSRPWAQGAYRALSRWSLLKRYAIQDWGYVSERLGIAMFTITGDGGTKEQRAELADEIKRLGRVSGMMLPKALDLKLVEAAASTGEIFSRQIAACDTGCAVCILGQNLSTQVSAGDGSKAATTEHGKTALGRTKADAETLSTCLHDQALVWWALYNFGESMLAPWPIWDTTPLEDIKDRAAALQMLGQFLSQAATGGAPVDAGALLEEFGVPTVSTGKATGQIFQYHLQYGIVTINEARERLGFDPIAGGDVAPSLASPATDMSAKPPPVEPTAPAPTTPAQSETNVICTLSRLPLSHPARAHHDIRARIAAALTA